MKRAAMLAIVLWLAFAAMMTWGSTVPPLPKRPHKSAVVTQGDGAAKLVAKAVVIVPPSPTTNTIAWQYPPDVVASNLWWNIEATTDLRTWTVLVTNATGASEITVNKATPLQAYRLSARLTP